MPNAKQTRTRCPAGNKKTEKKPLAALPTPPVQSQSGPYWVVARVERGSGFGRR